MWAYSDESERGATLLFGLTVVPAHGVVEARRRLRSLLLPGQRRLHTAKESPARRARLLDLVAELELDTTVYRLVRPAGLSRVAARRLLVAQAANDALAQGVVSWTLDDQEPIQAGRDRRAIQHALGAAHDSMLYDHRPGHDEPMLWAVDAIVWAVGTRGHQLDRVRRITDIRTVRP
jgi:hypothetical protein